MFLFICESVLMKMCMKLKKINVPHLSLSTLSLGVDSGAMPTRKIRAHAGALALMGPVAGMFAKKVA